MNGDITVDDLRRWGAGAQGMSCGGQRVWMAIGCLKEEVLRRLSEAGFSYVGISDEGRHAWFRAKQEGAVSVFYDPIAESHVHGLEESEVQEVALKILPAVYAEEHREELDPQRAASVVESAFEIAEAFLKECRRREGGGK